MKENMGEMSDEDKATDRWENEGGHTELARRQKSDQQNDC